MARTSTHSPNAGALVVLAFGGLGVWWLISGFSPVAWVFPLGFVFFIFTVLFISGMVIMCVSDFVNFFGERVFGWPFFGWACVFLLGFWKIRR